MTLVRLLFATLAAVLLIAIVGFAIFVASRQHLTFTAPAPAVAASGDSAVIARGRYVVRSVAACASCHGDPARYAAFEQGDDVPLSGGYAWHIPPGTFYALNITSDAGTGIGAAPDGAIARALRYGVGRDGRALLPFMEFQGLSDEDLVAVVSYLRTQPAVRNAVPPHHYNVVGMIVKATLLAKPVGPASPPPQRNPAGPTVGNGRYLVESVAKCGACHTERDPATGAFTGAPFAGATSGDGDRSNPKRAWSPPNITTAPGTGRLATLDEDEFIARMRGGRAIPGSPMPWQCYQRMNEDDLRAIYRYLKTVPPVEHDAGPPFVDAK
jgi:mono/diheme cytochrome c family protein